MQQPGRAYSRPARLHDQCPTAGRGRVRAETLRWSGQRGSVLGFDSGREVQGASDRIVPGPLVAQRLPELDEHAIVQVREAGLLDVAAVRLHHRVEPGEQQDRLVVLAL